MILTFQLWHYGKQREETKSQFTLYAKELSLDTTVKCSSSRPMLLYRSLKRSTTPSQFEVYT